MNYIWELAIRAINNDLKPDKINYLFGKPFSPYMELSFVHMNEQNVLFEVEINPYYRYYSIFKELFEPNFDENPEIKAEMLNIAIHHLKDIDVLMGMNKKEYYINFTIWDMKSGIYGKLVKERIHYFTIGEQKHLANNILALHETGETIHLFKDTVRRLFPNCYIFSNQFDKDEIVIYLQTKETKEKREKIQLLKYIFLPFNYEIEIFWENIFGIMGVDEFMKFDEILNY